MQIKLTTHEPQVGAPDIQDSDKQ